MCLTLILHRKNSDHIKILKVATTPSSLSEIPGYMTVKKIFINCWPQEDSYYTVKFMISRLYLHWRIQGPHIILVYVEYWTSIGLQTTCDVTNNTHNTHTHKAAS